MVTSGSSRRTRVVAGATLAGLAVLLLTAYVTGGAGGRGPAGDGGGAENGADQGAIDRECVAIVLEQYPSADPAQVQDECERAGR